MRYTVCEMASMERLQKLSVRFFILRNLKKKVPQFLISQKQKCDVVQTEWLAASCGFDETNPCCYLMSCYYSCEHEDMMSSAPMPRDSRESCRSRQITTLPVKCLSRIRTSPWIQVSYPNYLMVTIRTITCLEKGHVDPV